MSKSIVQKFADRITGQEYPLSDKTLDLEFAKHNNLVIVFGESDDKLEFRGAINDGLSANDGVLAYVINGSVFTESQFEEDYPTLLNYNVLTERPSTTVESFWCPEGLNASWLIKVEGFESAPFDVMEDGELYCRGAVFLLK